MAKWGTEMVNKNYNRSVLAFIFASFILMISHQGCDGGFQVQHSSSLGDENIASTKFEVQILDQINGSYRPLSTSKPEIAAGPTYKVVISDKNGQTFTGQVDWKISSIPNDVCTITPNAANPLEANLICLSESTNALNISIKPNLTEPLKIETHELTIPAFGEVTLKAKGAALYQTNCNLCHSSSGSGYKKDKTTDQIAQAIQNPLISSMYSSTSLKLLNATELRAIAQAVKTIIPADTTKPMVSITKPADTQTVYNTIQVEINASDDVELAKVYLEIDMGTKIGSDFVAPSLTSPFVVSLDTTLFTKGEHTLKATAIDKAGNSNISVIKINIDNTVDPPADTIKPIVTFASPSDGAKFKADFKAVANASDNIGVLGVQFYLDTTLLGAEDIAAPFEVNIPVATLASGSSHALKAEARDAAGNKASVIINFVVDKTAPNITITSPASGATLNGVLNVNMTATDAQGISACYIEVDGVLKGTEDTTAPYSISLDTNSLTNANHTIKAYARDLAGNINSVSIPVTVVNSNPYTTPEAELAADYPVNTANLLAGKNLWQTNCSGCHATEKRDRTYAVLRKQVGTLSDIPAMKSLDLISADVYKIYLYLNNELDALNPTVSFSQPTNGTTVSGTIAVTIAATDNKSVSSVSLYIDGVVYGAPLTTPPYIYNVDTKLLTNASHTLLAKAKDPSGNEGSSTISVIVNNVPIITDTTKPVVSFIQPSAGQNFSANFLTRVNATDNVAVIGVKLFIDGVQSGSEVINSPYDFTVSTATLTQGSHTLKAVARDAAGNINEVLLTVVVDKTAPTVTITNPTASQVLTGTFLVQSTATDSIAVAGVKWQVDGADFGTEDTTSPYTLSMDTKTLANGTHTLKAIARDAAGNSSNTTVSFSVNNVDLYNIPESELAIAYPATAANILAGKALAEANSCTGCHGEKRDRTYSVYRHQIGSLSDYPSMKPIDLISADVYKIFLYLTNTITGGNTALEQSQPLVGTRTYVASYFRNIFVSNAGTLADDTTIKNKITSLILNQPGALGGACQKNDVTSTDMVCTNKYLETSGGQMLPQPSALRRGYATRTCGEVLSVNQAVTSALEKITLTTTAPLSSANIALVYDLFLTGKPMPASVATALNGIATSPDLTTNLEKWRFVLFAICSSAGSDLF